MQDGIWTHAGAPSLEEAKQQVHDLKHTLIQQAKTKWDEEAKIGEVVIEESEGKLVLQHQDRTFDFVGRGLPTFCDGIKASGFVINGLLASGYVDLAGEALRRYQEKALKDDADLTVSLRCRTLKEKPVIRCATSLRYAPFDNWEAFDMLTSCLPESAGDAIALRTKDDGDILRGSLVFPDLSREVAGDSEYHLGLAFRNSENKELSFEIVPFTFRSVCLNGLIVGFNALDDYRIEIRHMGTIDRERLKDQVLMTIENALEKAPRMLDLLEASGRIKVPNPQQTIGFLARTNDLSPENGRAWFNAWQEEPTETGAGIIHGLTRAAQEYADVTRVEMETLAGQLIAPSIEADMKQVEKRWQAHVRAATAYANTYPERIEKYTVEPVRKEKVNRSASAALVEQAAA